MSNLLDVARRRRVVRRRGVPLGPSGLKLGAPVGTIREPPQPMQYVLGGVVIVLVALATIRLAGDRHIGWSAFPNYFFSKPLLQGVETTLELALICQVVAVVIGAGVAAARVSRSPVVATLGDLYTWIFRSVPLLVQLIFWFNIALLFPSIGISLPGLGSLWSVPTNSVISGFVAALLGLALHEGAFMAEIIRGGILSVPAGQKMAALAIGMSNRQASRYVIRPQVLRVTIPAMGNQFVGLLKATALVSVIGGGDLLTRAQYIYSQNFQVVGLLMVVTVWYLLLVSVASLAQRAIERHFSNDRRLLAQPATQAATPSLAIPAEV